MLAVGNSQRRVASLSWVPVRLKGLKPKARLDAPVTLGEHIKKVRKERGLRQRDVAKALGIERMKGTCSRPIAKGHSERIVLRLDDAQLSALDAWIAHQQPSPSRTEAIRTLLKRALAASAARNRTKGAPKAAQMASSEIDKLGDRTLTNEERADRKRKLILDPKEFGGMRRK